jgi:hypothetical protein
VSAIDPIRFASTIRYWDPDKGSGLAVADVPSELVPSIGGLRQQRVQGSIAGHRSRPTSCRRAAEDWP